MNQLDELLDKQPILLFDGECGFCNKSVLFFLKRERQGIKRKAHFAALNSQPAKLLREYFGISPDIDSIILIRDHSAYIKSCAALRMTKYMKGLWPLMLAFVIIPPIIRNLVYDFISRRRKKLAGRVDNCALLKDEDRNRFLDHSAALCAT